MVLFNNLAAFASRPENHNSWLNWNVCEKRTFDTFLFVFYLFLIKCVHHGSKTFDHTSNLQSFL